MTFFRIIEDRHVGTAAPKTLVSPTMDLIAIVQPGEQQILLHRPHKFQKLAHSISTKRRITQITFRPDGRVLALGMKGGHLALYNIENGECIHEEALITSKDDSEYVTSLKWVNVVAPSADDTMDASSTIKLEQLVKDQQAIFNVNNYVLPMIKLPTPANIASVYFDASILPPQQRMLLMQSNAPRPTEESLEEPEPSQISENSTLSMLCVTTRRTIHLRAFGTFPVANIAINDILQQQPAANMMTLHEIETAEIAQNLQSLAIVYSCKSANNNNMIVMPQYQQRSYHAMFFDTRQALYDKRDEIFELSNHWSHLNSIIKYKMQSIVQYVEQAWQTFYGKQFTTVLNDLVTLVREEGIDNEFSLSSMFSLLLAAGTISHPLLKWISNTSDKDMVKLQRQLESARKTICIYIRDHLLQRHIEHVLLRLTEIQGSFGKSSSGSNAEFNNDNQMELNDDDEMMMTSAAGMSTEARHLASLIDLTVKLQQECNTYLKMLNEQFQDVKNFIAWLRISMFELNPENDNEEKVQKRVQLGIPSMNSIDFKRLTSFLSRLPKDLIRREEESALGSDFFGSGNSSSGETKLDDNLGIYWKNSVSGTIKEMSTIFQETFITVTSSIASSFVIEQVLQLTSCAEANTASMAIKSTVCLIVCFRSHGTQRRLKTNSLNSLIRLFLYLCKIAHKYTYIYNIIAWFSFEQTSQSVIAIGFSVQGKIFLLRHSIGCSEAERFNYAKYTLLDNGEPVEDSNYLFQFYTLDSILVGLPKVNGFALFNANGDEYLSLDNSVESIVVSEDTCRQLEINDTQSGAANIKFRNIGGHCAHLSSSSSRGLAVISTENSRVIVLDLEADEDME